MIVQRLHVVRDMWGASIEKELRLLTDEDPEFVYMALALAGLQVPEEITPGSQDPGLIMVRGFAVSYCRGGLEYWLHDYMPVVLGGQPFVFLSLRFRTPDLRR